MDIERANAVCKVAGKLIDSALVEVKFLEAIDATATSEFFGSEFAASRTLAENARFRRSA
jgi:hypothetical protein